MHHLTHNTHIKGDAALLREAGFQRSSSLRQYELGEKYSVNYQQHDLISALQTNKHGWEEDKVTTEHQREPRPRFTSHSS